MSKFSVVLTISMFCILPQIVYASDYFDPQKDTSVKQSIKGKDNLDERSSISYDYYIEKGDEYKASNQLDSTMHYYLKGLEIAKEANDSALIVSVFNDISFIHYRLGDNQKSVEYIRKGYKYVKDTLSSEYLRFKQNEAAILNVWGKMEEAKVQYKDALDKASLLKDTITIGNASYNLAVIHNNLEEYSGMLKYLEQLNKYTDDPDYLFNAYVIKANMYHKQSKCLEAQREMDIAAAYVDVVSDYLDLYDYYYALAEIKICLQQTDSLMQLVDQITAYSDSASYEDTKSEALLLESRYASRIQADSIQLLTQQKQQQIDSNHKQRIILLLLVAVILACLLAALFFRKYYLNQKKLYNYLEESNAEKTKLFTNLTHELKTPLSLIKGLTELVQKDKNISAPTLEKVKMINHSSSKLLKSSTQLLEIAQNNFSTNQVNISTVPFATFLEDQLKNFDAKIAYKYQKMEVLNKLPTGFKIKTDVEKLATIFTNLLDNAVKYTEVGGTISIELEEDKNQNLKAIFANTGVGIHKRDLPHLFERYFRSKTTSEEGGFGIGLAIVKAYVDLLKGTIEVESIMGDKTQFFLTIPTNSSFPEIREASQIRETTMLGMEGQAVSYEAEEQAKILVVEDTYDYCRYLNTVLSDDYNLTFVNNGKHALKSLEAQQVDLIITDWMMPEMDGISLIKEIKKKTGWSKIPILLLSAKNLKSDKIRALRMNANEYLEKSSSIKTLLSTIHRLIESSQKNENDTIEQFENMIPKRAEINDEDWLLGVEDTVLLCISDFELNIEKIAKKMDLSPQQLSRKIKAITGSTAKKYIQDVRFWEARKLLETKEYDSVKSVCYQVGFKDPKNFSRNFKSRFGKYPSEFLKD